MVRKFCFKAGLYRQGLIHDLSKYSPTEFWPGVRYYQGNRSPNAAEREDIVYSSAWLHHKGRNRHHYEYWMDYVAMGQRAQTGPVPMPRRYIAEMICDRLAACHVYNKGHYEDDMPLRYYRQARPRMIIHPDTDADLVMLLTMAYEKGEDAALRYIKEVYLKCVEGSGTSKHL